MQDLTYPHLPKKREKFNDMINELEYDLREEDHQDGNTQLLNLMRHPVKEHSEHIHNSNHATTPLLVQRTERFEKKYRKAPKIDKTGHDVRKCRPQMFQEIKESICIRRKKKIRKNSVDDTHILTSLSTRYDKDLERSRRI